VVEVLTILAGQLPSSHCQPTLLRSIFTILLKISDAEGSLLAFRADHIPISESRPGLIHHLRRLRIAASCGHRCMQALSSPYAFTGLFSILSDGSSNFANLYWLGTSLRSLIKLSHVGAKRRISATPLGGSVVKLELGQGLPGICFIHSNI
jgi:hypothetical protein